MAEGGALKSTPPSRTPKLTPERPSRQPRPLAWWQRNGMHTDSSPKMPLVDACLSKSGQGPPRPGWQAEQQRPGLGGWGGGRTLPVQRFLHPQFQLLLWRQLGLGKGEKRRERGWVSAAPTTHLIQEPGACGGHVGRRDQPPRSTTRVWEAWGQLEPWRTVRKGRGQGPDGAEHSQPGSTPGLDLPAPPGPPCRPTGPSSRALLLAGIRRASSKFLLTLAAPVSLPAAGSVLGGRKGGCHL